MSDGHPPTPKLLDHARERCVEMGVGTGRVKQILRAPDLDYPTRGDRRIAISNADPEIAVLYVSAADGQRVAVTVLHRTQDDYVRGAG